MWYKTSDGCFAYYVNVFTKEKKLHLDEGDTQISAPDVDDFCW